MDFTTATAQRSKAEFVRPQCHLFLNTSLLILISPSNEVEIMRGMELR